MTSQPQENVKGSQRAGGEEGTLINRKRGTTVKRRDDLHMFNFMKFDYEQKEDQLHVKDHHLDHDDELNTKEILHHLLHSKPVHLTVIGLVILDTIFVLIEILIDVNIIKVDHHTSVIPHVLHGFSIAILSIFVIEISMKLYADRQHFLHHKIEVFDACVVIISFAFDITTAFLHNNHFLAAIGVLIVLRLWRVVRVINGIIVAVKDQADRELKHQEAKNEKLQKQNENLTETVIKQKQALEELVNILGDRGVKVGGEFLDELLQ